MIRQLPRWIWLGAILLAFSGGLINAVALGGFSHNAVSHVTGTTTKSAMALATHDGREFVISTGLILAFLAGAIVSGMIVGNEHLRLGRRYGVALILESGLLILSFTLFAWGIHEGELFASAACGLQNAMVATYSGAAIRTTHLTGIVSDIGSILGNIVARRQVDWRQLILLCTIFSSFYTGSSVGITLFAQLKFAAILVPAALTLATGISYIMFVSYRKHWFERYGNRVLAQYDSSSGS
jgi:uncharacterized membrane protein YoaK (UPF0700 family)